MATWIRYATADKTIQDADLTGTIELTNGTAPADFDPDAVTSVRFQMTCRIVSGTFESGGGEYQQVRHEYYLTLNGDAGNLAWPGAQTDGILDDGTNGGSTTSIDATDSSIPTGYTVAQWEGAELNTDTVWTIYNKNKGGDNVTVGYTTTNVDVIVTITYTPKANIAISDWRWYGDGSESGSVALVPLNVGAVFPVDTTPRLVRVLVKNTGASASVKPKLQYRVGSGSGSFGSWIDVNATSSNVRSVASDNLTDDGTTTQRIGSGSFVAGRIDESDGAITTAVTVGQNQETEFLFSVRWISPMGVERVVELRLVDADAGTSYDVYDGTPRGNTPWTWANGFEGGTADTDISTSVADPDAFDYFQGATYFQYDSTPVYDGSLSARLNHDGAGTVPLARADYIWQGVPVYTRFYLYVTTGPPSDGNNSALSFLYNTSQSSVCTIRLVNLSGSLYLRGNTADNGSYALSTGTWYRVEAESIPNSGDGVTDGKLTIKLYEGDSLTVLDTIVSSATTADTAFKYGVLGKNAVPVSLDVNFDLLEFSNKGWIGPLVMPRIPPQRRPLQLVRMKGDRREV